jgi:TPR repeat protein
MQLVGLAATGCLHSSTKASSGCRTPSMAPHFAKLFFGSAILNDEAWQQEVFSLAMQSLAKGDVQRARRLLKQAAKAGYQPAFHLLGLFVEHGIGGKACSLDAAMHWYKKACNAGDNLCRLRVAKWYVENGKTALAKTTLEKSGRHIASNLVLGRLYSKSRSERATRFARSQMSIISYWPEHEYDRTKAESQEIKLLEAELDRRTFWTGGRNSPDHKTEWDISVEPEAPPLRPTLRSRLSALWSGRRFLV